MADAITLGLDLLPADDDEAPPVADVVDAAEASALEDPAALEVDDQTLPFGRSWAFDWQAGRFKRQGMRPAVVTGLEAFSERIYAALYSARFAHAIFSDDFGMERPNDIIGEVDVAEALADYEHRMSEAILALDERVAAVENITGDYDTTTGTLTIFSLDVVTNEDLRIPFRNVTVPTVE